MKAKIVKGLAVASMVAILGTSTVNASKSVEADASHAKAVAYGLSARVSAEISYSDHGDSTGIISVPTGAVGYVTAEKNVSSNYTLVSTTAKAWLDGEEMEVATYRA